MWVPSSGTQTPSPWTLLLEGRALSAPARAGVPLQTPPHAPGALRGQSGNMDWGATVTSSHHTLPPLGLGPPTEPLRASVSSSASGVHNGVSPEVGFPPRRGKTEATQGLVRGRCSWSLALAFGCGSGSGRGPVLLWSPPGVLGRCKSHQLHVAVELHGTHRPTCPASTLHNARRLPRRPSPPVPAQPPGLSDKLLPEWPRAYLGYPHRSPVSMWRGRW